tara:strand:+ start:53 stop:601 length:549 start_codon:yes stop_codon:yes gene_type:complete
MPRKSRRRSRSRRRGGQTGNSHNQAYNLALTTRDAQMREDEVMEKAKVVIDPNVLENQHKMCFEAMKKHNAREKKKCENNYGLIKPAGHVNPTSIGHKDKHGNQQKIACNLKKGFLLCNNSNAKHKSSSHTLIGTYNMEGAKVSGGRRRRRRKSRRKSKRKKSRRKRRKSRRKRKRSRRRRR